MYAPSPIAQSTNTANNYQEVANKLGIDKLSENDRISLAATIGGSRFRIAVASVPRNEDLSKAQYKLSEISCPSKYESLSVIFDIFQTLAQKGLEIASFNLSGFTAQSNPEKAKKIVGDMNIANENKPGRFILPNTNLTKSDGTTHFHPKSSKIIDLPDILLHRAPGRRIHYIDSHNPPSKPYIIGNGKELQVDAFNDTIRAILAALSDKGDNRISQILQPGHIDRAGGFVNNTGFNFGIGQQYSASIANFHQNINPELGHDYLDQDHYLSPLTISPDHPNDPITAETAFAGGSITQKNNAHLTGIRREIYTLYRNLDLYKSQGKNQDEFLSQLAEYYNKAAQTYNLDYEISVEDIKSSYIYNQYLAGHELENYEILGNRKIIDLADDSLKASNGSNRAAVTSNRDKFAHVMLVDCYGRMGQFIHDKVSEEDYRRMKLIAVAGNPVIDAFTRVQATQDAFIAPIKQVNPDIYLYIHKIDGSTNGLGQIALNKLSHDSIHSPDEVPQEPKAKAEEGIITGFFKSIFRWIKGLFTKS